MDAELAALLGVVGLMAANQLVMRVGAVKARLSVFVALQLVNVVAGGALIWFGLPGFERWPVISVMIGLLFFLRTVQNNVARGEWLRERQQEERDRKERAVRAALRDRE